MSVTDVIDERSKRNEDNINKLYEYREKDKKDMIDEFKEIQKAFTKLIIKVLIGACLFFTATISVFGGIIWSNLEKIIK